MTPEEREVRSLLTDLLISDHERQGRPALPARSRCRLEEALRRLLVNRQALHAHIAWLQKVLGRRFRHTEPLPADRQKAVLTWGASALDDATLAALLLNPVALHGLYDRIDEEMPEAWLEALEEDGRRLMREHGRPLPPLEPPAGEGPA